MAKQEIGIELSLSGQQQLESGLKKSGQQLNDFGQTAAQTANNLRMIPAQMTDVVTSLASGQDPLTVLIQQGGQLKDGGFKSEAQHLPCRKVSRCRHSPEPTTSSNPKTV